MKYKLKDNITHDDLVFLGFVYRKHYDNYMMLDTNENWKTHQDLCIQIDYKTKNVDIYIHTLNGHRNVENIKSGGYNIQADIFPNYIKCLNDLKNILEVVEND
jgi:hypothetical protein